MIFLKKKNILLLSIALIAISFYGYNISKNKGSIKIINNNEVNQINKPENLGTGITKFTNVEYKNTSKKKQDYITRGKQAIISKKKPNLIELINVHSFTILNDGSILNVKSNKARYEKNTKDILYYDNVIIQNKDKIINADNANFLSNQNLIQLEKVIYKDNKNIIRGDFAKLNTITNNLEIFMKKKNNKVYGKREKK